MEVIAKSKYLRISPRKLVLAGGAIKGMKASTALEILKNLQVVSAKYVLLVLKQGIGNAVKNYKLDKENLVIKKVIVGKGPHIKRGKAVSRGQWHSILKRTSHITLILESEIKKEEPPVGGQGKKDGQ